MLAAESVAAPLSVQAVRSHFPALRRKHGGWPVAYFDGPGGTQVPQQVVDAMSAYLVNSNANTHWAYPTSEETDQALLDARMVMAAFLNAEPQEIAFGANMTTLTLHLSRAIGPRLTPGDCILVTELDHHANVDTWRRLEAERGVRIRTVRMIPETGSLDFDDLEKALDEKPSVAALGAASNALGTITDMKRVVAMARSAGALTFVDAVHLAPHEPIDVRALGCDFLVCSAYKFYGPHVGVLYGREALMGDLDFARLRPAPSETPERAETGTLNHEGIVGAAAAVRFLAAPDDEGGAPPSDRELRPLLLAAYGRLKARGDRLLRDLWNGLSEIPGVQLFGPEPGHPRTPTVSFTLVGHTSEVVARRLAEDGLFVSHGDFYAQTVVERLGVEGLVRVGCACYTSDEEVSRLIASVFRLAGD